MHAMFFTSDGGAALNKSCLFANIKTGTPANFSSSNSSLSSYKIQTDIEFHLFTLVHMVAASKSLGNDIEFLAKGTACCRDLWTFGAY